MQNFEGTNKKLDNLIEKLEANTGGQVNTSSEAQKTKVQPPKQQANKEDSTQQKTNKPKETKEKKQKQKKEEGNADAEKIEKPKKEKKATQEKKVTEEKKEEPQQLGPKDFALIDMRIGEIVECWKHPQSDKLWCEKISLMGEVREIASGLQKHVPIQEMKGNVVVMANLKPKPLAGFQSNGMVVCESNQDHTQINILRPEGANGERIVLEGFEQLFQQEKLQPLLNPKKKVLQKCLEHFKTDQEGFVVWKGIRCRTKAGQLKGKILKGNVS